MHDQFLSNLLGAKDYVYCYILLRAQQFSLLPHLLSLSFGWPTIAVDTHIDRVSNRTKFAMGKNVVEVEKKLEKVVPAEFKVDVHHWLILHGRYVCTARKPKCGSCLIEDLCEFKEKTE